MMGDIPSRTAWLMVSASNCCMATNSGQRRLPSSPRARIAVSCSSAFRSLADSPCARTCPQADSSSRSSGCWIPAPSKNYEQHAAAPFPLFCTVTTLDTRDQVTVELPLFIPNIVAVEAVNMLRGESGGARLLAADGKRMRLPEEQPLLQMPEGRIDILSGPRPAVPRRTRLNSRALPRRAGCRVSQRFRRSRSRILDRRSRTRDMEVRLKGLYCVRESLRIRNLVLLRLVGDDD